MNRATNNSSDDNDDDDNNNNKVNLWMVLRRQRRRSYKSQAAGAGGADGTVMTVIALSQWGGEDERYVATPHLTSTDVEWTHTAAVMMCLACTTDGVRSVWRCEVSPAPRVTLSTDTAAATADGRHALRTMSLASWEWNWVFAGDVSWYPATHNLRVSRCVLTEKRAHYWMTADMAQCHMIGG